MILRCSFMSTILSFYPHPSLLPLRHRDLLAHPGSLLSVRCQSPWRSGCSPSSTSFVGSGTRFLSGAPSSRARWRFRCACVWSGSGWNETPSRARAFDNGNISDVLCVCPSRSRLLFRYKVKMLIEIICQAQSQFICLRSYITADVQILTYQDNCWSNMSKIIIIKNLKRLICNYIRNGNLSSVISTHEITPVKALLASLRCRWSILKLNLFVCTCKGPSTGREVQ